MKGKRNLVTSIATALMVLAHATPVQARPVPSVLALTTTGQEAELLIYGPIGDIFWDGVTVESVMWQLSQLRVETVRVRINSSGGVPADGIAIHNALQRHPAKVITIVDGQAASIASLIVQAGTERVMPRNALMMIHAPYAIGAQGNAQDLRELADRLDTTSAAMRESYIAKAGEHADEVTALLSDGKDHWLTADEAIALGLADRTEEHVQETTDIAASAAAMVGYLSAIAHAPSAAAAGLRAHIQTAATPHLFASLPEVTQRALVAHIEDPMKKQQFETILANAGNPAPAGNPNSAPAAPAAPAPAAGGDDGVRAAVLNEQRDRVNAILATARSHGDNAQIIALRDQALTDPTMTVAAFNAQALAILGQQASPAAGGPRVQAGADERDRLRAAGTDILLARAAILSGADAARARQGNPFGNGSLIAMAEQCLIRAGVNTREMTRDQIAQAVLAQQGTSDFPIILENTLHRMVIGAYNATAFTWQRFCAVGTLSDYRPHARYHLSSFSDLKEVNEHGEYENGVLGDAAKETLQGKRKGRILQITPEVLVNDDLGAISRPAAVLGQAAGRTIEKDVYALFALNSGAGPTMSDGLALFHASHGNITGNTAPTVAAFDALRQAMGVQKDPGGNDYLDITPAICVTPLSLGGTARVVNEAQYDVDVSSKFQVPNKSRGMVRDVVDSPRLAGTAWYVFADPNLEPVFEVAFLDGVQVPTIEQETNFRTDGLSWKVAHRYAAGAVGWRGAQKNPGA